MQPEVKKLEALLNYMIAHNEEHADELKDLARRAKDIGKLLAYEELLRGVEQMKRANEICQRALNELRL